MLALHGLIVGLPCCRAWNESCVTFSCCYRAVNVYLPKDRVTTQHQGYGFVEFRSEEDADYVSGRYR